MATIVPYEGDDIPSLDEAPPSPMRTGRQPQGVVPYEGDDIPPPPPKRQSRTLSGREISQQKYDQGLAGTLTAQMQGQLHGATSVLGAPGDLASWSMGPGPDPLGIGKRLGIDKTGL